MVLLQNFQFIAILKVKNIFSVKFSLLEKSSYLCVINQSKASDYKKAKRKTNFTFYQTF